MKKIDPLTIALILICATVVAVCIGALFVLSKIETKPVKQTTIQKLWEDNNKPYYDTTVVITDYK